MRRLTVHASMLVAVLTMAPRVMAGQPTLDWVTTIPEQGQTTIADMATDSTGASFLAATLNFVTITLTRIDPDGSVAWTQTFNGPGGQDSAAAVTLSWDESAVYVLGRSAMPTAGSDYAILKYDAATGTPIWTRFVDGGDLGIDSPSDIAATPDGGAVATGGFDTPSDQRDFGTVRLDEGGNILWTRLYTGFGQFLFANDDATVVAVNDAGDVVISGNAMFGSDSDIVALLYDGATGSTLWEARWAGVNNDVAEEIAFTPDGDVVLLGIDDLTSGRRWVLARYDLQTGTEQWSLLMDLGRDETARDLAVGADGTVYATGSADPDIFDSNSNDDLEAIAVDGATGALLWSTSFGGTGVGDSDYGARIHPDGQGSVWVVGGTSTASLVANPFETDGLLLELSAATGGILSVTTLDTSTPTETNRDDLRHAGVDALGRLYVAGRVTGDSLNTLAARFQLGGAAVYCTAKTSSAGCLASISTSGPTPQPTSGAADYAVTASQVQELKNGLIFGGLAGSASLPFNGGTLCVQPPTKRGPVQGSGGSGPNGCGGSYSTLVNDGLLFPTGLDAGPGNSGWYQYWYRDPNNGVGQLGTALSNAVQLDFQ